QVVESLRFQQKRLLRIVSHLLGDYFTQSHFWLAFASLVSPLQSEASTFLEKYAQEEFLEEAIAYDIAQEEMEADEEAAYEQLALETYLSEVAGTDSEEIASETYVKAALIPRDGESVPIIRFMFNPTELNMSRDLTLNYMEGARTLAGLPKISFGYVNPYSIELAGLLFDTYETGEDVIEKYIDPIRDAMDFTKFGTTKDFVEVNDDGTVEIEGYATRGSSLALLSEEAGGLTDSLSSLTTSFTDIVGVDSDWSFSSDDLDIASSPVEEYDDYGEVPMTSKRPPVYYFFWGTRNYMLCFIQKINYKLTMFLPNGTPVRAVVDLSLQEVDMRSASRRYSTPQRMSAG
ncbi:hypothetical protein IQ255_30205, partial [Pleurocapsales cyanobacterium LEGE 10410]|nr:hypothetical protein [Pleurocapsales cyanobacterium LEGE 10410]